MQGAHAGLLTGSIDDILNLRDGKYVFDSNDTLHYIANKGNSFYGRPLQNTQRLAAGSFTA